MQNRIRKSALPLVVGLSVLIGAHATAGEVHKLPPDAKPARAAAETWLKLVDSGKYDESWSQSASLFKSAVPATAWKEKISAARGALGKLLSRSFVTATETNTAPGAPDGKYVHLTYKTSFEKKASATETLTPTLDKDGQWRIAGYFLK